MAKLKYTVEFEVEDLWLADGFRLTDEVAKTMIETAIGWSYGSETTAKVISAPTEKEIDEATGALDVN